MRKVFLAAVLCLVSTLSFYSQEEPDVTQGSLFAVTKSGERLIACPLKSTRVSANISGFVARVKVEQEFENSFAEPVEAVYTFPLSSNGAVDGMTMRVGSRTVLGKVMKKEEARRVYEAAKEEGKTAGLLDQERPNIFTQNVANIMPGEKIVIEITYVETLAFDDGAYEFSFPMTVTPRYTPDGSDADDGKKISPPIEPTRAGHDISIDVDLNAGVPVEDVRSNSHEINVQSLARNGSHVSLRSEKTIPNKDFVLRYDVIGKRMEDAVLASRMDKGGFFSLILSPPERLSTEDVTPKEIVFVLDTSGSMEGFPIEKAKESMKLALEGLYPDDTFNLITFAGDTHVLFDQPVPATRANLDRAQEFLASREGEGGTEMMDAIKAALAPSDSQEHMRIVCFMTDGAVGNDMEIIAEVKKHPKARVFAFGIGDSVNRFLLDNVAREGRGEVEYVMLEDEGSAAAKRFHERIRNPYLTDISVDWGGLPVTDVYPKRIPDLFGAKPIVLTGRYAAAASGKIKLRGKVGGLPFERDITVDLRMKDADNAALASLWARTKVDDLMSKSWNPETEEAEPKPLIRNQIVKLGVDFGIMTQFTSFVAVEERIVTRIRNGKRVQVPTYAPAGTAFDEESSGDGTGTGTGYGSGSGNGSAAMSNIPANVTALTLTVNKNGGGERDTGSLMVSGAGLVAPPPAKAVAAPTPVPPASPAQDPKIARLNQLAYLSSPSIATTISAGVINGKAVSLPRPVYPASARAVRAVGPVSVQVTIGEKGEVVDAKAVSGHPLLRAAAEKAAKSSRFAPTLLSGQAVKTTGLLTYNFTRPNVPATPPRTAVKLNAFTTETAVPVPPMSAEQKRAEKFHVWIFSLVDRLNKGDAAAGPNESAFVRDGKASIRIVVSDTSPAFIEKLKSLGFALEAPARGKSISGSIAIERLAELVEFDQVRYILPKI